RAYRLSHEGAASILGRANTSRRERINMPRVYIFKGDDIIASERWDVEVSELPKIRKALDRAAGTEDAPSRNKPFAQRKSATRRPKSYIARRGKPAGKVSGKK